MQTAYAADFSNPRAGSLADLGLEKRIVSKVSAELIPFGRFLSMGASDILVKLPAASTDLDDKDKIQGIAVATQMIESQSGSAAPGYPINESINVLRQGVIWVFCETAFNPVTDALFVRYTANGALVPGNVRNDADTAKALDVTALISYRVENTLLAAGLLKISLNLP